MTYKPGETENSQTPIHLFGKENNDPVSNINSDPVTITELTGSKVGLDTVIRNPAALPIPVSVNFATALQNITVNAAIAATEYPQALPANTKGFFIKARNGVSTIQLAFTLGQSGTNYVTIPAGTSINFQGLNTSTTTLYLQVDVASIVEVVAAT